MYRRILSLLIALFVMASVVGCGGQAAPSPKPATPTPAPAKPVAPNNLVIGYYRDFTILDPHKSSASLDGPIMMALFDRLIEANGSEGGKLYPSLAESWQASNDGKTWTFKLRKGVKFHDGTPFNAQAVKFNFDRIANPATKSESAVFQLGPYAGTRVIDEFTVAVDFKQPYGVFPFVLASYTMSMVSPKAATELGERFGQNPVGSGPYKFVEWKAGASSTIEKNPDYNWAPAFQPRKQGFFDRITFRVIQENTTRAAALDTGEIDAASNMAANDWLRLKKSGRFGTVEYLRIGYPPAGIFFNVKKPPTDDVRVRQALIYALDSKRVRDVVYEGVPGPSGGVMSTHAWAYEPKAGEMYPYNKAKAEQLLDEAGWKINPATKMREKNGKVMEIQYLTLTGVRQVAEVVEPMYRELGIKVNILPFDNPMQQKMAQEGQHNLVWTQWGGTDPSEIRAKWGTENIGSGWNFCHYSNPKVDELLLQGERETDPAKRKAIYSEIQMILMRDATIIPLNNVSLMWAFKPEIKGWQPQEMTGWFGFLLNLHK